MRKEDERGRKRLMRLLLRGPATVEPSADEDRLLLCSSAGGAVSFAACLLEEMLRRDLVRRDSATLSLTGSGRAFARRQDAAAEPFREQHQELEVRTVDVDGVRQAALVNNAESPLARLAQRRTRNGEALLSAAEFRAGERLRLDYTRGQIMPRLGASWQAAVASGRRSGGHGAAADITDAAIAARQRVEKSLAAVGPELAGVLVDVCCFLKGLERVESERGWPVRSAKVVLKTALAALARHYEPARSERTNAPVLHWGTADFRPKIRPAADGQAASAAASS